MVPIFGAFFSRVQGLLEGSWDLVTRDVSRVAILTSASNPN